MMTESGGGDVENPSPPAADEPSSNPHDTAAGVKGKKWKVIALSVFLITAVVLAIALGVSLGNKDEGGDGAESSQNTDTTKNATTPETPSVTTTPPPGPVPTAAPPATDIEAPAEPTTTDGAPAEVTFEVRYLRSTGPLASKVRIANPGVARGYESCADLKDDILNALKYYAYSTIVRERDNGWFRMCNIGESCIRDDVCRTGNCTDGECVEPYWVPGTPSAAPTWAATPTVGASKEEPEFASDSGAPASIPAEDSFDTNTQVQGVDEADVVKANKDYVFAAYGDVLWAWNSSDASEGRMSMTQMPREPRDPNCTEWTPAPTGPWPTRSPSASSSPTTSPRPSYKTTPFPTETSPKRRTPFPTDGAMDNTMDEPDGSVRQRRVSSMPETWYGSCEPPKPKILSLLLAGPRLTAIVSKPKYSWRSHIEEDETQPIISDEKIVVRVYNAENIPADGGPLTLLGEQEIKGSYTSARSIGPKGVVVSQSNINSWRLVSDLYRYNTRYCGLNSTEYEELATETALGMVDSLAEQMIDELALQPEGTCDNWFQVAAMVSGNGTEAPENTEFLDQLVQVATFDMSSDFVSLSGDEPPEIPVDAAAVFASGSSQTVFASQDFVASVNVGYEYNATSGDWDSATFIQGFDISSTAPKPFSYAELPGSPLNQYSLDLYQNHLRVVTTQSKWWPERKTTNKLWVLELPERGPDVKVINPEMKLTGETGHLGKPNEEVFAVRFMSDLAYVVTFEQTDPFYVLNVTDHTNPIVLGELQIPGFSSYLHPIQIDGVKMMIGVGRHVEAESGGREVGAKISLFDVSDPMNPTENATYIDVGAYSSAGSDFYSFRYLNKNQKLILPKSKWTYRPEGNFDGFQIYDVDLGSIAPSYEVQHADSQQIYDWCGYGARMPARSLVFQSQLTTILSHSVISTDLATGSQNWNVSLDEGLDIDRNDCIGYFY